jgi:hypothetical protein
MGANAEQPADNENEIIVFIRENCVLIDADLAWLYGVTTKQLKQQVKRNIKRFPDDFMFQLTPEEKSEVVSKHKHLSSLKFSSTLPYAFTFKGIMMAASLINTPRAIEVSVDFLRKYDKISIEVENYREKMRMLKDVVTGFESRYKDWQLDESHEAFPGTAKA